MSNSEPNPVSHIAYSILALEEQVRVLGIGKAVLVDIEKQCSHVASKLERCSSAKDLEVAKALLREVEVTNTFKEIFQHALDEFEKAAKEIEDEGLRYRILHHARNMVANARVLGNVGRRNIFEEMRNVRNGRKAGPSAKSLRLMIEIEKKVEGVLRDNPGISFEDAWTKVRRDQRVPKPKSVTTLRRYFCAAWQKKIKQPPL